MLVPMCIYIYIYIWIFRISSTLLKRSKLGFFTRVFSYKIEFFGGESFLVLKNILPNWCLNFYGDEFPWDGPIRTKITKDIKKSKMLTEASSRVEVEVCHPRAVAQRRSCDRMKTYLPHIFLRKGYVPYC